MGTETVLEPAVQADSTSIELPDVQLPDIPAESAGEVVRPSVEASPDLGSPRELPFSPRSFVKETLGWDFADDASAVQALAAAHRQALEQATNLYQGWQHQLTQEMQRRAAAETPVAPVKPEGPPTWMGGWNPAWSQYLIQDEDGQLRFSENAPQELVEAHNNHMVARNAWWNNMLNDPVTMSRELFRHALADEKFRQEVLGPEIRTTAGEVLRSHNETQGQRQTLQSFLTENRNWFVVDTPQGPRATEWTNHLYQIMGQGYTMEHAIQQVRRDMYTAQLEYAYRQLFAGQQLFAEQRPLERQTVGQALAREHATPPRINFQTPPLQGGDGLPDIGDYFDAALTAQGITL